MKQKSHMWVIIIIILLLVGVTVGYKFLWGDKVEVVGDDLSTDQSDLESPETTSPEEDTATTGEKGSGNQLEEILPEKILLEDIEIATVDLDILRNAHPKMKTYYKLEEQISSYQTELTRHEDDYNLALEQVENQNSDLTAELNTQLEGIRDKYQKQIDDKTKALQAELIEYEEQIWEGVLADIQRKKDDLQSLAQEMIISYSERQSTELEKFQEELSTEKAADILNLRLKLQLVQLTEQEQQKYQEELDNLQIEMQQRLEEKSVQLEEELEQFIENKQTELDNDLKKYQETRKLEAEEALKAKSKELDNVIKDFIAEKEQAMYNEFEERQTKLEEQAKTSLLRTQKDIQQELLKKEEMLRTDFDKAKKEQEVILQEIEQDIRSLVAELAETVGIDLVLTDVRVSVDALDLTQQVLQKLKQ